MFFKTQLCFIFLFFLSPRVFSFEDSIQRKYFPFIGFSVQKGFIIPHSQTIREISHSKPWIFGIDYARQYVTEKAWSYCACYPNLGISASFIDFNYPSVLGKAFAIAPYVEPFLAAQNKLSLSFRFSAGVVYLTNVFDSISNPQNLFFSTHISYILGIKMAMQYRLSRVWTVSSSISYNHISNGGVRLPNKGMNFPTISIAAGRYLVPPDFKRLGKTAFELPPRNSSFRLAVFGTAKKPFTERSTRYPLYGAAINWNYPIGRKSDLTLGTEFVNDVSLREYLKETEKKPQDHKKAGFLAGHVLVIGRFLFSQQLGVYLYSPSKNRDPVYERWGLEFQILRKLYARINLKAHRQVADFMDFGIGWSW